MYLNVHSQYSLRYGTMSIPTLVEEAFARGVTQMVLTDINNSTGIMEFMRECLDKGIKPIAGMEYRRDKQLLFIGIARNKEGMKELNDFRTEYNLEQKALPHVAPTFVNAFVVYPYGHRHPLKENEYLGIRYDQLNRLFNADLSDIKDKLVALQPVFIADKIDYRLHEYLRGIDLNVVLTEVDPEDKCAKTDMFLPPGQLEAKFARYGFILDNTRNLMNCCVMDYPKGRVNLNRRTFTGNKKNDRELLEKLANSGMEYRYGKSNKEAIRRVKHELKVIYELDFCAYFLITWDIIRYSSSQGYYHVGRGSGANSIVAYCLKITDVDPIELDLYFERFLNAQRTSPPDFDIDYSWDEREDVQDYIFKRYGSQHTALLGTMSTFKDRSIIREIGKVMGLPKSEIDSFTDQTQAAVNQNNETFRKIVAIHERMANMPNQRSIHAGGILITEDPITYYTALDLPPKGMATVQWDMYEAEKIGFDKYDILSQRGIGHIKMAVRLVEENQQRKIDIHQVKNFMKDPSVNANLRIGNTKGCFYIESPAMIQLNRKLKCDSYLVLVAASSIIRPGVASSGMMGTFIKYHNAPETVSYLHPVMKEILKETYGVMVYQEDVIKVCIHFAGMDGTDADILRRGMSGKYRSKKEFDRLVQRFHELAIKAGRPEEVVKEVWRQVSSFAGYSFSKAHSASFAVESYQSLYLKTYYPREFMVAVLNNYGGFYDRALYVQELQRSGGIVHLPCVNNSDTIVNIQGVDVYLGLVGIHGLNEHFIQLIPEERKAHGVYQSLEDLIKRTGIGLEQAIILIRVGALRFTGKSKKELLWAVHLLLGAKVKPSNDAELFQVESRNYSLPVLVNTRLEDAYHELELLGFPLSMTMFDLLQTDYRGDIYAADLINHVGESVRMVGEYVCEKTVVTKRNEKMWFGNFLDADGNSFDTVHFPNNTPAYPFRGKGCYLILGKVVAEFGFASLEVMKFAKLPILPNPVIS
ncbi:DNA polymerase III subunit alpha [Mucilaginibacter terrenus]|uniref:DNA-directed DNA polymerase n=1 Tax=Mucilaginibacter terrenus TaxID=2482727 RepID=A0A3E2NW73_9SPHI|nr:DNA polymerase III subunit alpha [Mucilaginibacter terrenus]RFZ85263.1 DNA polymerase III subunit alpha [Mucilaginibacter terrenus]